MVKARRGHFRYRDHITAHCSIQCRPQRLARSSQITVGYPRACHGKSPSVALAAGSLAGPVQAVLSHALSLLRDCPDYLANVVSPVDCGRPRRGLRSSSSSLDFSLPRLRTKFGERAFTYAGPSAWNSLPKDLRAVTDPGLFRKRLKTLFLVWRSVFADNSDDSVTHP